MNIKGITWDHPRGYQALRAISGIWFEQSGKRVNWDVRSLRDFGDMPLQDLTHIYDLLVIDHPWVGTIATDHLFVPLDEFMGEEFLQLQKKQSVGKSYESYWYENHCWALPIDVSAQMAAYRPDLMNKYNLRPVKSLNDLYPFIELLPDGIEIGVPLCPTDIWCVFLSLCSIMNKNEFFSRGGIELETGVAAIDFMRSLIPNLHPLSFKMNPIQMLDYMRVYGDIIYTPFIFGYSNYGQSARGKIPLLFTNSPYITINHTTLLGGAGIAISSQTKYLKESIEFIKFVLGSEKQQRKYAKEQGHPAHLNVWLDVAVNKGYNNFFIDTVDTFNPDYALG